MKAAFNNMNTVQHCSTLFAKSLSFEICHFRGVCTAEMIHSDCCSAPFFDVPHPPAFSQNVTVVYRAFFSLFPIISYLHPLYLTERKSDEGETRLNQIVRINTLTLPISPLLSSSSFCRLLQQSSTFQTTLLVISVSSWSVRVWTEV